MNARKIINTFVLVCIMAAIVLRIAQSNDTDEFFSGLILGVNVAFAFVMWQMDL